MLGNLGLSDEKRFLWINAGGQIIQDDIHYLLVIRFGIKRSRDAVVINYGKNSTFSVGFILQSYPVFDSAQIVAQV